jgi:hypothetical protein
MFTPESSEVVRIAKVIIASQANVPRSPAVYTASGINLCLAAAVAKAGFVCRGWTDDAERLSNDLARTQSKDRLRAAFRRLGWSESDCSTRLELNDSASDHMRKSMVLDYLNGNTT